MQQRLWQASIHSTCCHGYPLPYSQDVWLKAVGPHGCVNGGSIVSGHRRHYQKPRVLFCVADRYRLVVAELTNGLT